MLDTNVVVITYLSPHGAAARLFQVYQQDVFALVVSEAILTEYQAALNYPKVQSYHHMNEQEVATVIDNLRHAAILITHQHQGNAAVTDRKDVKVLACAVAGDAEYAVSEG